MKKILFILLIFLSCNNTNSDNREKEYFYKIQEKYVKSDREKDFSELMDFYNVYKQKEIKEAKEKLEEFYRQNKDMDALQYMLKNSDIADNSYYLATIYEDCENSKCLERLLKFYNSAYELTRDIERFSSVLDFGSEVLGKEKYESLEKFSIDNNSLYAINIKKTRENMIEEEYENPKIRIKNKQYIILQEKEINLVKENQKIKFFLISSTVGGGGIESYLYFKNKGREYLTKLEIHTVGFPYNIELKDLNGDGQEEIIIENLKDGIFMSLNKLYVFKVTENGMEKKLNTYDIDLKKYFDYKMNIKNMVITVKDDFGYRKDTEYKLPDRIETRFFGAFDGVIQGVVKDKIIMRVINFQNYEIVFDKDLNYKLKAITSENNPLNLSVNYGLYEQAK